MMMKELKPLDRKAMFAEIDSGKEFDIVIIGGGASGLGEPRVLRLLSRSTRLCRGYELSLDQAHSRRCSLHAEPARLGSGFRSVA